MNKSLLILLLSTCLLGACSKKPQPITYGRDGCDFCRMTIVDKGHAAQLVTQKGKNYKFDAIECLVHYLADKEQSNYSHILVASLNEPGILLPHTEAVFIISNKIPSPMGAFLSAVRVGEDADDIIAKSGGSMYNWEELNKVLNP